MVCGPNTMAVESSCWLASPFFELVVPKGMFTAVVGYILWMYTDIYRSIDPAQPGSVPGYLRVYSLYQVLNPPLDLSVWSLSLLYHDL